MKIKKQRCRHNHVHDITSSLLMHVIIIITVQVAACRVGLTSLSPDCSPPYLFVPIASNSSMKIIAPYTVQYSAVQYNEGVREEEEGLIRLGRDGGRGGGQESEVRSRREGNQSEEDGRK